MTKAAATVVLRADLMAYSMVATLAEIWAAATVGQTVLPRVASWVNERVSLTVARMGGSMAVLSAESLVDRMVETKALSLAANLADWWGVKSAAERAVQLAVLMVDKKVLTMVATWETTKTQK